MGIPIPVTSSCGRYRLFPSFSLQYICTFWVLFKMKFIAAKLMLVLIVLAIMVQDNITESASCGYHYEKCCPGKKCRVSNWCCNSGGYCKKCGGLKDIFLANVDQIEKK